MRISRHISTPVNYFLAFMMFMVSMPFNMANAAMVGTETIVQNEVQELSDRDRVQGFLDRQDVQEAIKAQGIDPSEAQARVNSLSNEEVTRIAGQLDHLPAGGSLLTDVLGVALVIAIVLFITDILGLTDVYPFVNN